MDQSELRHEIARILREEAKPEIDWPRVQEMCAALDNRLRQEPETQVPDVIYHLLDDSDVRQKDAKFAVHQRELARRYVETGEMVEHAPSESWWSCLLTFLLLVGGLVWLLS